MRGERLGLTATLPAEERGYCAGKRWAHARLNERIGAPGNLPVLVIAGLIERVGKGLDQTPGAISRQLGIAVQGDYIANMG